MKLPKEYMTRVLSIHVTGCITCGCVPIIKLTPNEDRKDWLYTGSLHFENGTLPIIVRPIITLN